MASNRITIKGRLTRDFEMNYAPSGYAFARSAIAETSRHKDGNGEIQESVKFFNVEAKGHRAEKFPLLARKGALVHLTGFLDQEKWQDKDGHNRETIKIVILELVPIDGAAYAALKSDGTTDEGTDIQSMPKEQAPAAPAPQLQPRQQDVPRQNGGTAPERQRQYAQRQPPARQYGRRAA